MAMLRFTDADYGWVTQQVKAIADRHAKGRIVSALEGRYALSPSAAAPYGTSEL
jgi:acetoin utilization deacetylase AcuC-like enzyme